MPAELPASITFMLDEFRGTQLVLGDVQKRFSDRLFVRDYFDQCGAAIRTYKYADHLKVRPGKFDICAGSGLDPLSPFGKCSELGCVVAYAHQFARTACLYADRVAIPDPFSFTIESTHGEILWALNVLKVLRPLIEAGIVVFSPAAYVSCHHCAQAVESAENQVAAQLWQEFARSAVDVFRFKDGRRWRLSVGSLLLTNGAADVRFAVPATKEAIAGTKPYMLVSGKNAMKLLRQYRGMLKEHFAQCAHKVVFDSITGRRCGTTVVTSTRQEAAGYRLLDRHGVGAMVPEWSMMRTVQLPALQQLTAIEAMQVREEAGRALPAFRAKLQRDLVSLKDLSDEAEEKRALEVAAELRLAARELQGQFASLRLQSVRRRENLLAGLAIGFEIVSLTSRDPATVLAAGGTFAALMIAAHQGRSAREEKHELLVHQPAYVLLTAERVHQAKHQSGAQ
jgi:hypothetical protein